MKFPAIIVPQSPDFYVYPRAKCKFISVCGDNKGEVIEDFTESSIFEHSYHSSAFKMIVTNGCNEITSILDPTPQDLEKYGIEVLYVTALNIRKVQAKATDGRIYCLSNTFYDSHTHGCIDKMLDEIDKTTTAVIKLYKKDEDIINIEYDTNRGCNSPFKLTTGMVLDNITELK